MRRVLGLVPWLVAALAAGACSSPPPGADQCRSIEVARCKAALSCKFGVTASNENECELFARDHCLHGPLNSTLPTTATLDTCVNTIGALGSCAHHSGSTSLAKDCLNMVAINPSTASVCDVIQDPEEAAPCEFLTPTPTPILPVTDSGVKDAGHD